MAISKRLRYEILRRDDHTCRYCGGKAPDVRITIDHVVPLALGGIDEPENLVAACVDCNTGKSSVPVAAPLVQDVEQDAMRWAAAMKRASEIQAAESDSRRLYVEAFEDAWHRWTYEDGREVTRPAEWASYIGNLHDQGLELTVLIAVVDDVLPRRIPDYRMWRYFCGAIRNVMADRADIAAEILRVEDERNG